MRALLEGPLVVHTAPAVELSEDQFFEFCQINRDLRIERSAKGDLIIMPSVGGSSSHGNIKLASVFENWAEKDGTGTAFDSSCGFILPNRAIRSPDISWVHNERLARLSDKEWQKFLPLCPDFVLELRSPSDALIDLKEKMEEYMANGAQLGWLLDPIAKQVLIYRPRTDVEVIKDPAELSGEPLLKGFSLDVRRLWAVMERKR